MRSPLRSPLTRRARIALTAGITAFIVLAGTTTSFALWTATTSLGSTATGATIGVSHALTGSTLARTYTTSDLVGVGVVTVTNTSSRTAPYSVVVTSTSATDVRAAVTVELGTAAACTTTATLGGPAVSGTMAAATAFSGSLAPNASAAVCVRTSMTAANVTANSAEQLSATIASSVALGTWTASASPAVTFTQVVATAPVSTIDQGAYYWIKSSITPFRCVEVQNYNGSSMWLDACDTTGSAANELWRFVPTDSGYYRIVPKSATTTWWSTGSGSAQNIARSSNVDNFAQWLPVRNTDGSYSFTQRGGSGRCATVANGNLNTFLETATCGFPVTAGQRFTLTMFNTATPAPITLTCTGNDGGYNVGMGWPPLTGYQGEVVYRVYIGGILVNPHANGTGYDPTVLFSYQSITTGVYGSGSKQVLVQQSVNGGPWTNVGTRNLVISNAVPFLQCG